MFWLIVSWSDVPTGAGMQAALALMTGGYLTQFRLIREFKSRDFNGRVNESRQPDITSDRCAC